MTAAAPESVPGYRPVLTFVGSAYVLLALMNLARGAEELLGPFGVPEQVLGSAHFLDFYHWLFVHMMTIGVLWVLLGRLVVGLRAQRLVAFMLLGLQLHYTYLDWRTSTWGSGLYANPKSLVLVAMDALVVVALAAVCLRSLRTSASTDSPRPNAERTSRV